MAKRKPLSAAHKQKLSQAAKARIAKAKNQNPDPSTNPQAGPVFPGPVGNVPVSPNGTPGLAEPTVSIPQAQLDDILRRLDAAEKNQSPGQPAINAGVTPDNISADGKVRGIIYKYPLEKSYYPDPTGRLQEEPALSRFAFKDNYILKWDVDGMVYQTRWGITYAEPKFTLVLYRRMFDEEGNPRQDLIEVQRQIMFEDAAFAQKMAVDLELDTAGMTAEELLNELRYQRIRRWLLSVFNPPNLHKPKRANREMVVAGKVVKVVDAEDIL